MALSESQKKQIIALETQRMEEISTFRKSNSNKEEIEAKTKNKIQSNLNSELSYIFETNRE